MPFVSLEIYFREAVFPYGTTATLSCDSTPPHHGLKFYKILYGLYEHREVDNVTHYLSSPDCASNKVAEFVRDACANRRSCNFTVDEATFGLTALTPEQRAADGSSCPDTPLALRKLGLYIRCGPILNQKYMFTQDWFTDNIDVWYHFLLPLIVRAQTDVVHVLEVGAFEGAASTWLIDHLLVC